jgi:uncharacterized protein YndB with AHSA1/START domain
MALAMASVPAFAQQGRSWRDFEGVSNTSFVEANGDRAIQLSIEVPAPPNDVFEAYATTDGFKSWAVPIASIDLRVGGAIESNYNPDAKLGERDNIRNEIVAYVPDRILVLRNVQAPRTFVDPELFQRTVTVVEFAASGAGTRVTITNAGYGAGEQFDRLYRQFEWGDAYTLAELRARFVRGPVDWTKDEANASAAAATKVVEGTPP